MSGARSLLGPGLIKIRAPSPVTRRLLSVVGASDSLWAALFEHADVVSEGLSSEEQGKLVYRGTTSVILLDDRYGGLLTVSQSAQMAKIAGSDPHLRVRLVRLAQREALSRVSQPLDCTYIEIIVRSDPRGICAEMDVFAQVFPLRGRASRQSG